MSATDPDTGINDVITYSIEGIAHSNNSIIDLILDLITRKYFFFPYILSQDATVEGLFDIMADTGIIFVSSEIDREKIEDNVVLYVKVHLSLHSLLFFFSSLQKMKMCKRTLALTLKFT